MRNLTPPRRTDRVRQREECDEPATLVVPFPRRRAAPTERFEVQVPRSDEDLVVDVEFFAAAEAKVVEPRPDQTLLFAPDGSAFLFRIGPRSA